MQELLWMILLCLCPVVLFSIWFSYVMGRARGEKDMMEIDREYDKKFKEMVADFITEHYERKKGRGFQKVLERI